MKTSFHCGVGKVFTDIRRCSDNKNKINMKARMWSYVFKATLTRGMINMKITELRVMTVVSFRTLLLTRKRTFCRTPNSQFFVLNMAKLFGDD